MTSVFLKILNMGIVAGWIALLVMLVRLPLKKAPRFITVLLWVLVAVRLIFPFSPESPVSLVPDNEPIPANIFTPEMPEDPSPDAAVYPTESDGTTTGIPIIPGTTIIDYPGHLHEPQITVKRHVSPVVIAACIWAVGVAAMAVWAAVGCIRIKLRVREAIPQGGNVYICDRVGTPFIFGLFRPHIYLPSDTSEGDAALILTHERTHIARLDHIWKPLGFLLLSLYWFNPILWVAYIMLCRDIEIACDEKVLHLMGPEIKKQYSDALINCSVTRTMTAACPLAFGETGVKERVRRVLNYKKPAFWIIITALIVCAAASVCLLTDQSGVALDRVEGKSLRGLYDDIAVIEFEYSDGESLSHVRTVNGDTATLKKAKSALRSISVERQPIAPTSADKLRTWDCRVMFIGKRGETNHKICFSDDGSEFFGVRDGGSYTATYRVRDPEKVTAFIDILKDSADTLTQYPDDTSEKAYHSDSATPQRIAEMREKYPHLFGLDTSYGLYLYVTTNGNFDCALFPRPVEKDISLFFDDVEFIPLPHMRIILSSYGISADNIHVTTTVSPLSSTLGTLGDLRRISDYLRLPVKWGSGTLRILSTEPDPVMPSDIDGTYDYSGTFEPSPQYFRELYPYYFDLPTENGLCVHVTDDGAFITAMGDGIPGNGEKAITIYEAARILWSYKLRKSNISVILHTDEVDTTDRVEQLACYLCLPESSIKVQSK